MIISIIGMGPRGLASLENLLQHLPENSMDDDLEILIFEKSNLTGYGHVYDINQEDSNWINITERALEELPGRPQIAIDGIHIPAFKTYMSSSYRVTPTKQIKNKEFPDIFPRRSIVGNYLKERYESLTSPFIESGLIKVVHENVESIEWNNDLLKVLTSEGEYDTSEVLLTIGHQPTNTDKQLKSWREKVAHDGNLVLIEDCYPVRNLWSSLAVENEQVIAVRGFGLAAIDVIRSIVDHHDGSFITHDFHSSVVAYESGRKRPIIVPFSLNGLPPVPKPYSEKIDMAFTPSPARMAELEARLLSTMDENPANHLFLVDIMAEMIAKEFLDYQHEVSAPYHEINMAVLEWIMNGVLDEDHMVSPQLPALEMMKQYVAMAMGERKASLDYYAGQVWRHCQPMFYKLFSHSKLNDLVMASITDMDEMIKRYSYGPPVASIKQLILLAEEDTLNLDFLTDPDIQLGEEGWKFTLDDDEIIASCMINSIIDSAQIAEIKSTLVSNLLSDRLIKPVHSDYGLKTKSNGQVITPETLNDAPIYVLGRLAKGSVMGVDAILECFGERIDDWAEACVERITSSKLS